MTGLQTERSGYLRPERPYGPNRHQLGFKLGRIHHDKGNTVPRRSICGFPGGRDVAVPAAIGLAALLSASQAMTRILDEVQVVAVPGSRLLLEM